MTAVDFLIKQIKNDQTKKALSEKEWLEIFKQAKQLEKQENLKLSKTPQTTSFDTLQWNRETTNGNNE